MKQILLLDIDKPKKGKYQFFLDWFKEEWIKAGGSLYHKIEFPFKIRLIASKLKIGRKTCLTSKKRALLAIGGAYIDFTAFPYNFFYEIVPVYWDTWKQYHPLLISSLKRNKIRYAFFTQKEVATLVQLKIPGISAFWLPEGIRIDNYKKGEELKTRSINILQYGRKLELYHQVVLRTITPEQQYLYSRNDLHLLFITFEEFSNALSNSSITICFPRSLTHPEITGGIETLTQRYWECMLSRCLIIGKAPQELIELMGYNPVIEVDWERPEDQLKTILESISSYQSLVDQNYNRSKDICSWEHQINKLKETLNEIGFRF